MAYTVDNAQVELIARALFQIDHGGVNNTTPPPNPDDLTSMFASQFLTREEQWDQYPNQSGLPSVPNTPKWKKYRPAAINHYAAMHEMGLT